jgi:outer membrane protein OmpA-like peptidoglycan-associated protein
MKKYQLRVAILLISMIAFNLLSTRSFGQDNSANEKMKGYFYIQPNIGMNQYFGDLNIKDYWNQNPKFAYGLIGGYQVKPVFGVRGQFVRDNIYSERADQNKILKSKLWDASLQLTININDIFSEYNLKRLLNFYLFTGGGITSYKSNLTNSVTSMLINEHTDRQHTFFLPVGAGASIRLTNTFAINLEYGDRTIFGGEKLDFTDAGKENNDHYNYVSAGLQIKIGVKDTDDDGVIDREDLCPEVFGRVKLAGCPDKDNDGIADKDDDCPDVYGNAEFKGCPDTDGDGIIDSKDVCPDAAGKPELNGCPDKDNDGITDKDDKCPEYAGSKDLNGCPDRDGDGIADNDDACPDVKGSVTLNGCPDSDGDGIADKDDKCPDSAGVVSNSGCPEIINFEFSRAVCFGSSKSVILPQYSSDLDETVTILNEHPEARVSVEGYTDSQESDEYNLKLSEKRADYVYDYLVKKGVPEQRLVKSFYGKANPVNDNKTAAGRAKNRRVEIKTIK